MIDRRKARVDPDSVAGAEMVNAFAKNRCLDTFCRNAPCIQYFTDRMPAQGLNSADAVIVLADADDVHGRHFAELLMPGENWQKFRTRGRVPYGRGLLPRYKVQELLETFDPAAAAKLRVIKEVAIVVVDFGVAEVFPDQVVT